MPFLPQRHRSLGWVLGLGSWGVMLVAAAAAWGQDASEASTPEEMKPYVETIPGTDVAFEMVPIPGGVFLMGSPENEPNRRDDEGPQVAVEIAPFWMGKHEVTWDEYDLFAFRLDLMKKEQDGVDLDAQPDSEKRADAITRPTPPYADETFGLGRRRQPVICITHHAALEYCRWLSTKTGKTYRLPTEAEWEYAARAGTTTAYSWGDDPDDADDYAWSFENTEKPQRVGRKEPNPWGLHDMHGNVAEWCLDHYVADIYQKLTDLGAPVRQPVVPPSSFEYPYVARGGSWDHDPEDLRSAVRFASEPDWNRQDPNRPQSIWWHTDATFVGFRIVRPLEEQENLRDLHSQITPGTGTNPSPSVQVLNQGRPSP